MTDTRIIRAVIYLRISDLRQTDLLDFKDKESWAHAIERYFRQREQQLREFAERLSTPQVRWEVVKVIRENDVIRRKSKNGKMRNASAHRKRKMTLPDGSVVMRVWRPGFQEMLTDLREGVADGILCENLNRVLRDQRDGLDLRDVAQEHNVNARSLAGTLTLTDGGTRGERTMLGIMTELAADFSDNLAWSVAQGRERKSRNREYGGGPRPFGFEPDGITKRPDECAIIKEMSERVIKDAKLRKNLRKKSPHSMHQLVRELNAREVPTVTGVPWTTSSLKDILLRPRNAGLWVFRGKEVGKAPWASIIPVSIFRRVVKILTSEDRASSPGGQPAKWLGSGVFECGKCDDGTTVEVTNKKPCAYKRKDGTRTPVAHLPKVLKYRCSKHSHLSREMRSVDQLVTDWVVDRLSQPDVIGLFKVATPDLPPVDVKALEAEKATLEAGLEALAVERVRGEITKIEHQAARKEAVTRIGEIDRDLNRGIDLPSPIQTLCQSVNVRATWESYPLATKQAIVRRVARVRIMPCGQRGAGFREGSVSIEPVNWEQVMEQAA